MPTTLIDLTNRRFGKLTVIARDYTEKGKFKWLCRCDCGAMKTVAGGDLRRNDSSHATKSCGCWIRERILHHGHKPQTGPSLEYISWLAMKARCTNPKNIGWKIYGGRGIKICARWVKSFEAFLADLGPRPSRSYTLDRIDSDGPYSPENCRWAKKTEQSKNRKPWITPELRAKLRIAGRRGAASRWGK